MKIHIVQRNDSFQTIANKYGVSVQDLIGMNTHINHLTGLVPGLKVKVPSQQRKEEPTVDQHIQKYYPNLEPVAVQPQVEDKPQPKPQASVQPVTQVPVQTKPQQEEVMPIPLKPFPGFEQKPTQPNDGVIVSDACDLNKSMQEYLVMINKTVYEMKYTHPQMGTCGMQPVAYGPMGPMMRDADSRFIFGVPFGGLGYGGFGGYGMGYGYPFMGYGGYNPYWGYGYNRPYYGGYGGYYRTGCEGNI